MNYKKNFIRCLGMMLCLVILVAAFTACGEFDVPADTNVPGEQGSGDVSDDSAVESRPNDKAELPEGLDFGGKIFSIRSIVQQPAAKEFSAESSGGIIDKAVYERNQSLQKNYNCFIINEETVGDTNADTMYNEVTAMVSGGNTDYQILVTAGYKMCALAMKGYLADISTMEWIDTTKDYYSQGHNEALSIGDSQYLITGKMSMSYYRYMMVMFYNRGLFEENKLEDPQQLVLNQQWTLEKATNMAIEMIEETGNVETNTYGFYGFVGGGSSQTDGWMSATNMRFVTKDDSNYYKYEANLSRASDAVDKIYNFLHSSGSYVSNDDGKGNTVKAFTGGRAGMITYRLFEVESSDMANMGSTGSGYGILPLPKLDSAQTDYVSYVQDQCLLFGFPVTLKEDDKQAVGTFFEAYSASSYRVTKDTYYERALTSRYLDVASTRVMEIIDTNVYVDPVNVYINTAFKFCAPRLRGVFEGTENFGSTIQSYIVTNNVMNQNITELNETFKKIANGTAEQAA